jgi:hypothetical protein
MCERLFILRSSAANIRGFVFEKYEPLFMLRAGSFERKGYGFKTYDPWPPWEAFYLRPNDILNCKRTIHLDFL